MLELLDTLTVEEVVAISEANPPGARSNPEDEHFEEDGQYEDAEGEEHAVMMHMAPIEGTHLLVGPHVPVVLND